MFANSMWRSHSDAAASNNENKIEIVDVTCSRSWWAVCENSTWRSRSEAVASASARCPSGVPA